MNFVLKIFWLTLMFFVNSVVIADPIEFRTFLQEFPSDDFGPISEYSLTGIGSFLVEDRSLLVKSVNFLRRSGDWRTNDLKRKIASEIASCCYDHPTVVLELMPVVASLNPEALKYAIKILKNSNILPNTVANAVSFALRSEKKLSFKMEMQLIELLLRLDTRIPRVRRSLEKLLVKRINQRKYDEAYKAIVAYFAGLSEYKTIPIYALKNSESLGHRLYLRYGMFDELLTAYSDNWLSKLKCHSAKSMVLLPPEVILLRTKAEYAKQTLLKQLAKKSSREVEIPNETESESIKIHKSPNHGAHIAAGQISEICLDLIFG